MKKNVLIVGAGGVAHVAAHKCAQNNDVLGDICIASRTQGKCDNIIESIKRKDHIKDTTKRLHSHQLNALNIPATVNLIKETNSQIVVNLAQPYVNMSLLTACVETGASYIDTAVHEESNRGEEKPPWYANYEWPRKNECKENGITAVLGAGFDPGVVNAYCALAVRHHFDTIDTIDVLDVNVGDHGEYFATNFDPEINFREFRKIWNWIDRKWVLDEVHSVKMTYDFPVVGKQILYLNGHDELHSLSKNIDANSIRFWMGFSDHFINVFTVLSKLGLTSEFPIKTAEGVEVVPLKMLKSVLPDPFSLAPSYTGETCIGNLIKGRKDGKPKELFIYNICDHVECYKEVESQAICYTAGVPPAAASILIAQDIWDVKTMVNVEELPPAPFIELLDNMGLPTVIQEKQPFLEPSVKIT